MYRDAKCGNCAWCGGSLAQKSDARLVPHTGRMGTSCGANSVASALSRVDAQEFVCTSLSEFGRPGLAVGLGGSQVDLGASGLPHHADLRASGSSMSCPRRVGVLLADLESSSDCMGGPGFFRLLSAVRLSKQRNVGSNDLIHLANPCSRRSDGGTLVQMASTRHGRRPEERTTPFTDAASADLPEFAHRAAAQSKCAGVCCVLNRHIAQPPLAFAGSSRSGRMPSLNTRRCVRFERSL